MKKKPVGKFLRKLNEFQPLLITIGLTAIMSVIYSVAPSLLEDIERNPYTPYYNASEFHDIIRRMLKVFAYSGIAIALMMMLVPGAWVRIESVMKNDKYEPRWLRDTFIFLLFLGLLWALVSA